jgi:hypothetical protein
VTIFGLSIVETDKVFTKKMIVFENMHKIDEYFLDWNRKYVTIKDR